MSPLVRHWLCLIISTLVTAIALTGLAYQTGWLDMRQHEYVCLHGTFYVVFRSGVTILVNQDGSYAQCVDE